MTLQLGGGAAVPSGTVTLAKVGRWPAPQEWLPMAGHDRASRADRAKLRDEAIMPDASLHPDINRWRRGNLPKLRDQMSRISAALDVWPLVFYGSLHLRVFKADGAVLNYGLASLGVVTTAGVNYVVADIIGGANDSNLFRFHGIGTGTTAEAIGDTALVTELTTQYQTDSTRPTGTQTTGGTSNVYRTVGTIVVDAAVTIAEHGIFSQAAVAGGTLLDRSQFTGLPLASGDTLQSQYDLSLPAGG
jgi:hypothetical protein